jgi:hypothetical protein
VQFFDKKRVLYVQYVFGGDIEVNLNKLDVRKIWYYCCHHHHHPPPQIIIIIIIE